MHKKDFRSILKKYLQGRATAKEEQIIDSWYAAMGKDSHSLSGSSEESQLENRYWSAIGSRIKQRENNCNLPRRRWSYSRRRWSYYGIAASIVFGLLSFFFLLDYAAFEKNGIVPASDSEEGTNSKLVFNTGAAPLAVTLPDHSIVTLEPKSELRFSPRFDQQERAVYLVGEAFFEISHDISRPFLVYANKVTTKVLGTSFRVRAFQQDRNITVAVKTGKVSVYTNEQVERGNTKTSEIILTPNQQVIYDKAQHKLSRMIVEKPQAVVSTEEMRRMRFEAAPVSDIFRAIEKVYAVELVFDNERFSSCTLTTFISDGDLYNRLDIICKAIGATYSIRENQIVIDGAGCYSQ